MTSKELSQKLARLSWEKKGNDILILDVKGLTDVTDYFVLVTAESDPHVKAISDYLQEKLEKEKLKAWHKEGYQNLQWVLLDYIDVVVHIFQEHYRKFYELEKLWGDARIIRVEEDAKNRMVFAEQN
ncbi:MAG: ribosome silencing factor [bacterium]|nr:MAG: ribosome silencing factor [bacterium]